MREVALVLCVALVSCAPPLRRPESSQVVITGTLFAGGFAQRGEPVPGATVTLRSGSNELARGESSTAGGYRLAATLNESSTVTLVVEKTGFAPFIKSLRAGPYTEFAQSASLQPLTTFDCVDTACTASRIDVEWLEPPSGASGEVASFELELENPLQAATSLGAPLALAYVKLQGGNVGTLALRIPATAWSRLGDALPGNGTLEVTTAAFDPKTATWTTLAPAQLFSESGVALPESALPLLQRQEYAGGAVARLPVQASSFIAVLGAIAPTGCLTGVALAEDKPAQGVVLTSTGAEPVATNATGAFCIVAPTGTESHAVRTQYAGLPYALLALPQPTTPGSCGGTCRDIGTITIAADALRTPKLCKFTGRVIDTQGQPVANAEVVAIDDSVLGNNVTAFCGESGTRCSLAAPSKEDGTFTLNIPLLTSAVVAARVDTMTTTGDSQRSGGLRVIDCPTESLTLRLQRGVDRLDVTASFSGDVVTWSPPRAAARLTVFDSLGVEKWSLAPAEGATPPVTVTTVVAAGDSVLVELDGVGRDGVVYFGSGSATR